MFVIFLCLHEQNAPPSKGLSQKEVALSLTMNPSQYSKIENGKVDPQCSSIEKIANALGVSLASIFTQEDNLDPINSIDKSIIEKVQLIEQLDDKQKESIFNIIDMAIYNLKRRFLMRWIYKKTFHFCILFVNILCVLFFQEP